MFTINLTPGAPRRSESAGDISFSSEARQYEYHLFDPSWTGTKSASDIFRCFFEVCPTAGAVVCLWRRNPEGGRFCRGLVQCAASIEALFERPYLALRPAMLHGADSVDVLCYFPRATAETLQGRDADLEGYHRLSRAFKLIGIRLDDVYFFSENTHTCLKWQTESVSAQRKGKPYQPSPALAASPCAVEIEALYDVMNRSTVANVPALLRLGALVEGFLPVLDAEDLLDEDQRRQAAAFPAYAERLSSGEAQGLREGLARQAFLCLRKLESLNDMAADEAEPNASEVAS